MNPSFTNPLARLDGLGVARHGNPTPVQSQNLPSHDDRKVTWVLGTLTEILQSRVHLLDAPVVECDQENLSLSPFPQSKATWCTDDIHTQLMSIYSQYGPTIIKFEGPDRDGLSWIKFYKLYGTERGRTKVLVHVIWIKPNETLLQRIRERIDAEAEKLRVGQCLPDSPTLGRFAAATERPTICTKESKHEAVVTAAFGSTPTLNTTPVNTRPVSSPNAKAANAALLLSIPIQNPTNSTDKAPPAFAMNTANMQTHTGQMVTLLAPNASDTPETAVSQTRILQERSSLSEDIGKRNLAEVETEGWGVVSCISLDSEDGEWTHILDEDLAW